MGAPHLQRLLHKLDHSHRPLAPRPPHTLDHRYAHSLHHHHLSYRERENSIEYVNMERRERERGRERGRRDRKVEKKGEREREGRKGGTGGEGDILHFKSIYFFIK